MAPKKKAKKKGEEEETLDYNPEKMNTQELRLYARMLQKDIDALQNHRSFYLESEENLKNACRERQELLRKKEGAILESDMGLERLRLQLQRDLEQKRQLPLYLQCRDEIHARASEEARNTALEADLQDHQRHVRELNSQISETSSETAALRLSTKVKLKHLQEEKDSLLLSTNEREEMLLSETTQMMTVRAADADGRLAMTLGFIEKQAIEDKMEAEEEFLRKRDSYKETLREYFKEVTRRDLDAVAKLKKKIDSLKDGLRSLRHQMENQRKTGNKLNRTEAEESKDVLKSNSQESYKGPIGREKPTNKNVDFKELEDNNDPQAPPCSPPETHNRVESEEIILDDSCSEEESDLSGVTDKCRHAKEGRAETSRCDCEDAKRSKKLRGENEDLLQEVRALEDETDNLRSRYTRTLCVVRDTAEMRAVLLERKIRSMLVDKD